MAPVRFGFSVRDGFLNAALRPGEGGAVCLVPVRRYVSSRCGNGVFWHFAVRMSSDMPVWKPAGGFRCGRDRGMFAAVVPAFVG